MVNSRIDKYRNLRNGLKDEVGINHDNIDDEVINTVVDTDDEFLTSVNRLFNKSDKKEEIEDTLTEAKTFEQMRQESSEEINRALRSAKVSVGKEAQYNTRMDILNKIREPEKEVVRIDKLDNVETGEFSKGYFVNQNKEEPVEISQELEAKKKMTLMERLASMSPDEDVKKAKVILEDTNVFENGVKDEEVVKDVSEQTASLEDMLRQIKEKDQREIEKVLQQKETESNIKMTKNDTTAQTDNEEIVGSRVEVVEEKKNERVVNFLNYVIIFLFIVFIALCGMIGYQLFF